MRKVFISYARQNKPDIEQLVEHLRVLGCDTWHDSSLHGGEDWWEEILRRIADCDTFIAIISRDAMDSTACRREFDWAESLDKPVLPVAVESLPKALPRRFSKRQIVDYSVREDRDRAALTLAGGLATLPAALPLPDPLPEPPAAPLSYLTDLIDLVTEGKALDHDQQRHILNQLEPALYSVDPEERQGGHDILEMLSGRDDLYADVYRTINRLKDIDATGSVRSDDRISTEPSSVAAAAESSASPPGTMLGDDIPSPDNATQQRDHAPEHTHIDEDPAADLALPERPDLAETAPAASRAHTQGDESLHRGASEATPDADHEAAQADDISVSDQPQTRPVHGVPDKSRDGKAESPQSISAPEANLTSTPYATPTTVGVPFLNRLSRRTKIVLSAVALVVVVAIGIGAILISNEISRQHVGSNQAERSRNEAILLGRLPARFSRQCQMIGSSDWGAIAEANCGGNWTSGGVAPTGVNLWLFGDDASVTRAFSQIATSRSYTACPGGVTTWAQGQVACNLNSEMAGSGVLWTNHDGQYIADAYFSDYSWFQANIASS